MHMRMHVYVSVYKNMFMRMHVYLSGIWNILGVPISEKKVLPHCIAEDVAEKTQWKLIDIYMYGKVSTWQLRDIFNYLY